MYPKRTPVSRRFAPYIFIIFFLYQVLYSAEYYVAVNGDDENSGSLEQPFATIQKAADTMVAGDTCYIREGVYHQTVEIDGLVGTLGAPIRFTNYSGETVTLDGSQAITDIGSTGWTQHEGNIYKTTLTTDIWQLYLDGELMISARWPNANLDDGSVWDWNHWAWGDEQTSSNGTLVDEPHGEIDLAASDLDMTGAVAVLDVGSWKSWTRVVNSHEAGTNTFTYDVAETYISKNHYYFLEAKLNLLDVEEEWFYDSATKTLYLYALGGGVPAGDIRGKTQTYAFNVINSSRITLEGLNFFGTTIRFYDSPNTTIEECGFLYPSCSKRMLGSIATPEATMVTQRNATRQADCIIRNCSFDYVESHAIFMEGDGNRIENCIFRYIDWAASELPYLMGTIYMRGPNASFVRNTVHTTGASQVLNFWSDVDNGTGTAPLVEYCRFYRFGLIQDDGAAVHVTNPTQPGQITRYNWYYDSPQFGARFDAPIPPTVWGHDGWMHHNVGWNCKGALMVKGEYHYIYNNSGSQSDPFNDIAILNDLAEGGGGNIGTITRNNAATTLSGDRLNEGTINGTHDHNWNGYENGMDLSEELNDPDVLDFRPQQGSSLIDAGIEVPGITDGFVGLAPDIGAYEYGKTDYWIPGYQPGSASFPIPQNNSTNQSLNRELMYLIGRNGIFADVYLGTSFEAVDNATVESEEYEGRLPDPRNIHSPGILSPNTSYYWRVDTLLSDERVIKGPVWEFRTGLLSSTGSTCCR